MQLSSVVALRGLFGDGDGEPEGIDPALEPLCRNGRIETTLEVVGTGVFVEGTSAQQVPGGVEHGVGHGDGSFVRSPASGDARVLRRVVATFGPGGIGASIGAWIGGLFGGFAAALLAIPVAAAIQVVAKDLWGTHAADA